jgi:hypothetical protein
MADISLAALREPDALARAWRIHGFRLRRLSFYEDFLDSGVELRLYCRFRAEKLEGRGAPDYAIVREIGERLAQGRSVAAALDGFVPPSDLVLIAAHESRGTLRQGIAQVVETVREEMALRAEARGQLATPLIYLLLAIGLLSYGLPWMVSLMSKGLLKPGMMSLDQRALVASTGFMSRHALQFNVIYALVPALYLASLRRWTVTSRIPGRGWLDRNFAPYAAYRAYHAALFLRSLGAQLAVTPKLEHALEAIRVNSNRWLADYIRAMELRLPSCRLRPILALDVGLLDAAVIDSLMLVSLRGDSEQAITSRAQSACRRASATIRGYVGAMRTAAYLLLGTVLAWAVLSLMTQTIKQQTEAISNPAAAQRAH